ncbi:MAG: hypothetical protein ACKO0V_02040 [bacterium]
MTDFGSLDWLIMPKMSGCCDMKEWPGGKSMRRRILDEMTIENLGKKEKPRQNRGWEN